MHVIAGKMEMRGEESTNVVSEEERLGFGSLVNPLILMNPLIRPHASWNVVSPLRTANL